VGCTRASGGGGDVLLAAVSAAVGVRAVTLSSDRVSGVARRGGRAKTSATAAAAAAAVDGPFLFIIVTPIPDNNDTLFHSTS